MSLNWNVMGLFCSFWQWYPSFAVFGFYLFIYLFVYSRHEVHSMNTHTLQNAGWKNRQCRAECKTLKPAKSQGYWHFLQLHCFGTYGLLLNFLFVSDALHNIFFLGRATEPPMRLISKLIPPYRLVWCGSNKAVSLSLKRQHQRNRCVSCVQCWWFSVHLSPWHLTFS